VSASAGAVSVESSMMPTPSAIGTSGARRRQASAAQNASAAGRLTTRSPAKCDSVAISTQ
jgi:hypothetical protein